MLGREALGPLPMARFLEYTCLVACVVFFGEGRKDVGCLVAALPRDGFGNIGLRVVGVRLLPPLTALVHGSYY